MELRSLPDGRVVEVPPDTCPEGHRLVGPGLLVGWWVNPESGVSCRGWRCGVCGHITYDQHN